MRIFVNARFLTQPLSGVQRYGIECSRQIKKRYPQVQFIAPGDIVHHDVAKELDVVTVGRNTGHLWEQYDLPLFMRKQKSPPLLNLANTAPLFYGNNFITIHDLAFHHHPEWNSKKFAAGYNFLIPRLAHNCRHLFTVSNTVKSELVQCYKLPESKISVTYNGLSQSMLAEGSGGKPAKEKIILSVGTFTKRKNHQNLIAAFLESKVKGEYSLAIIGDKNKIFSEAGIDEHILAGSNIKIMARLDDSELIAAYQKAEIVVSLSLYEGFGIPLLEGLYSGCKIICSDIPVYRELYGGHARFCLPTDIHSIAAALEDTARAPASASASADLFQKYSYGQAAEMILEKILAG